MEIIDSRIRYNKQHLIDFENEKHDILKYIKELEKLNRDRINYLKLIVNKKDDSFIKTKSLNKLSLDTIILYGKYKGLIVKDVIKKDNNYINWLKTVWNGEILI